MKSKKHLRADVVLPKTVESLESRRLMHVSIVNPVSDLEVAAGSSPTQIDLSNRYDNLDVAGPIARLDTTAGSIFIELFASQKPETVAKFLSYFDNNAYDGTIFHSAGRMDGNTSGAREFLSTGGYTLPDLTHIATTASVADEFTTNGVISNVRGTVSLVSADSSEFQVNLSDDSSYIANQDLAHRVVFGQVIEGSMSVADDLALTPAYAFPAPFNQLPLSNYSTFPSPLPVDGNYLKVTASSQVPEYTLSVASDNTALVSPTISDNALTLSYGSGQTGIANVTVSITSLDGDVVTDSFQVAVGVPSDNFTPVNLGVGGSRLIKYTAPTGLVTLSLSKGSAVVKFSGTITAQSNANNINVITGDNLLVEDISISGTGGKGTLSIASKGEINVTNLSSDEGLTSISGAKTHLVGEMRVSGNVSSIVLKSSTSTTVTGSVGTLKLLGTSGDISVASAGTIIAPQVDGHVLTSAFVNSIKIPILNGDVAISGAVKSAVFLDVSESLDFGSIGSLVARNVGGHLTVSGTASSVKLTSIAGDISIGGAKSLSIKSADTLDITLGGDPGKLVSAVVIGTAADVNLHSAVPLSKIVNNAWTSTSSDVEQITAPRITAIVANGSFAPSVSVVGRISSATFKQDVVSDISAGSIGTMKVLGNLNGDITATDAYAAKLATLSSLLVKGVISGSVIRAAGHIGSISTIGLFNSSIFAGTDATSLPTQASEFASPAFIRSISVSKSHVAGQATFSNSQIAASTIASLNLGSVNTTNSAAPFGAAADTVNSFAAILNGTTTRKSKLTDAGASISQDDFVLRIL